MKKISYRADFARINHKFVYCSVGTPRPDCVTLGRPPQRTARVRFRGPRSQAWSGQLFHHFVTKTYAFSGLAILILALGGCSQRPTEDLAAAQKAVDEAFAAEADVYASADYNEAFDLLQAGQGGVAAEDRRWSILRSYREHAERLEQAVQKVESVLRLTEENKRKAQQEAEQGLEEVRQLLEGMGGAQDKPQGEAPSSELADLENAFQMAQQDFEDTHYLSALKRVEALKEKLTASTR